MEDISPNIAGTAINNNLEGIEYDVEKELGAAATDGDSGSVENYYEKFKLYVNSLVGTLPKSFAMDNVDLNVTKLEENLSLAS